MKFIYCTGVERPKLRYTAERCNAKKAISLHTFKKFLHERGSLPRYVSRTGKSNLPGTLTGELFFQTDSDGTRSLKLRIDGNKKNIDNSKDRPILIVK